MITVHFHTDSNTKVEVRQLSEVSSLSLINNRLEEISIFLPNYEDAKEIAELLENTLKRETI